MISRACLAAGLALCLWRDANAHDAPPPGRADPNSAMAAPAGRSDGTDYCSTPTVGVCGACSVACPADRAAACVAGVTVSSQPGAACATAPDCHCIVAHGDGDPSPTPTATPPASAPNPESETAPP